MKRKTFVWVLLAFVTLGGLSSGCGTAPNRKPASTITAIKAVNDQVETGNVNIEGDTDTAPPP